MKTKLFIFLLALVAGIGIVPQSIHAGTQAGIIFEVTGTVKTSEVYNNCPVYAYDGTSQTLTIKAYAKNQYYEYASGSFENWWYGGSVTYSTSY
jgi:hypothetical protein